MKTLKLLSLFLVLPLVFHAQNSLTGLWVGSLSNDSVTVRKDQSFEIALTEYKQKVYGYSRSSFIVNDTLYYVLKRVKGTINGDVCEVKDDEIISYNFRGKLDKGVKMTSTFRMNKQDSTWHLVGDWKTNQTKRFYSISGKVELKDEPNYEKSKIFPHLEELKVADEIAFYASTKKPVQQTSTPSTNTQTAKKEVTIAKAETPKLEKKIEEPAKQEEVVAAAELRKTDLPANKVQAEERKNLDNTLQQPSVNKPDLAIKKEEIKPLPQTTVEEPKERNATAITKPESEKKIITTDIQKPEIKIPTAAAFVAERKTVAPQIVEFKSDSLELRLYDNGEIDGDTVSILLNGEIILAKQGLKAAAIKKTIHIAPGNNEVSLVLYAENLGKYPPNTGLLVVYDGEDIYQVRFSADLQQNAAVVFRRKK
jgi:hypothetical protein